MDRRLRNTSVPPQLTPSTTMVGCPRFYCTVDVSLVMNHLNDVSACRILILCDCKATVQQVAACTVHVPTCISLVSVAPLVLLSISTALLLVAVLVVIVYFRSVSTRFSFILYVTPHVATAQVVLSCLRSEVLFNTWQNCICSEWWQCTLTSVLILQAATVTW